MLEVRQTERFADWFRGLRDVTARVQILRRIERLQAEHVGDVKSIGGGVRELRVHHGPGYRVYFMQQGDRIILLLCGGDKGSQSRDIARAKAMAEELE